MTTNDYIKELKSHLSVLDNKKKNEIVQEIESYIEESNVDYSLLVDRFGTPEELASSYLEDMPIKEQPVKKIWSKTKKAIVTIAIFLIVVFIIVGIIIYNMTKDPFDYSKYTAKTIDEKVETPWVAVENIDSIEIEQARVVIYWSDQDKIQASCQGNRSEKIDSTFEIKQSECFLKVPKQKMNIKSYQAKVVVVEPKSDLVFDSKQSRIKIALKGNNYKFDLKGTQTKFKNLNSKENGILIKGDFYQSKVSPYEY